MKNTKTTLAQLFYCVGDLLSHEERETTTTTPAETPAETVARLTATATRTVITTANDTAPVAVAAAKPVTTTVQAKAAKPAKAVKAQAPSRPRGRPVGTKTKTAPANLETLVTLFVDGIGPLGTSSEVARAKLGVSRQVFEAVTVTARERNLVRKEGERRGTRFVRVSADAKVAPTTTTTRRRSMANGAAAVA